MESREYIGRLDIIFPMNRKLTIPKTFREIYLARQGFKMSELFLKVEESESGSFLGFYENEGNKTEKYLLDKTSKIYLPSKLINELEIKERAIFLGMGNNFELWNPARILDFFNKTSLLYEELIRGIA